MIVNPVTCAELGVWQKRAEQHEQHARQAEQHEQGSQHFIAFTAACGASCTLAYCDGHLRAAKTRMGAF